MRRHPDAGRGRAAGHLRRMESATAPRWAARTPGALVGIVLRVRRDGSGTRGRARSAAVGRGAVSDRATCTWRRVREAAEALKARRLLLQEDVDALRRPRAVREAVAAGVRPGVTVRAPAAPGHASVGVWRVWRPTPSAPGPPSGAFRDNGARGAAFPSQPVQGVSAILPVPEKPGLVARAERQRVRRAMELAGLPAVFLRAEAELAHARRRRRDGRRGRRPSGCRTRHVVVPFRLVREDTPERWLTGSDFDPESVRANAGRHVLDRRRVRSVPAACRCGAAACSDRRAGVPGLVSSDRPGLPPTDAGAPNVATVQAVARIRSAGGASPARRGCWRCSRDPPRKTRPTRPASSSSTPAAGTFTGRRGGTGSSGGALGDGTRAVRARPVPRHRARQPARPRGPFQAGLRGQAGRGRRSGGEDRWWSTCWCWPTRISWAAAGTPCSGSRSSPPRPCGSRTSARSSSPTTTTTRRPAGEWPGAGRHRVHPDPSGTAPLARDQDRSAALDGAATLFRERAAAQHAGPVVRVGDLAARLQPALLDHRAVRHAHALPARAFAGPRQHRRR